MEADWEVETGGNAPVIEALWPGLIDLRSHPEHVVEIDEAAAFPPLAALLVALNAPGSPVWTSKCDVWEPNPDDLACYLDLLSRESLVFTGLQQTEAFCREFVARLDAIVLPECGPECRIDLVIRQAIAGKAEGFGITAYLSVKAAKSAGRAAAMAALMAALANAIPPSAPPRIDGSKLQ